MCPKPSRLNTQTHPGMMWWKLSLPLPVSKSQRNQLWLYRCTGIHEDQDYLYAYFPDDPEIPELLTQKVINRCTALKKATLEQIPSEDWEAGWKKYFKPKRIGKHFVVRPSWENYSKKKGDIVLIIDPKMSFGTGTHPTTRLMLLLMETLKLKNQIVFDAGSGTGILAIAAVKLGARRVDAVDVETESYENAKENIRQNQCEKNIRVRCGSFADRSPRKRYDCILANIQRSVLEPHLHWFYKHLTKDGHLLLSGLLKNESLSFSRTLKNAGWIIRKKKTLGEWTAFLLSKQKKAEPDAHRLH